MRLRYTSEEGLLWEARLIPGIVGVSKVNRGGYGVSAQHSQAIVNFLSM